MIKIDPNLESAWELMIENQDVFSEKDLIVLLEGHLNYDVAIGLRGIDAIPPCYQYAPCIDCVYVNFCRNQERRLQGGLSDASRRIDEDSYRKQLLKDLGRILSDSESWEF